MYAIFCRLGKQSCSLDGAEYQSSISLRRHCSSRLSTSVVMQEDCKESEMENKKNATEGCDRGVENGSNKTSKPSFPTAANLRLYEAWNEPSLHELCARKTLERKNVDGHIVTHDLRFMLTPVDFVLPYARARVVDNSHNGL